MTDFHVFEMHMANNDDLVLFYFLRLINQKAMSINMRCKTEK